jgi:hypothetical protein
MKKHTNYPADRTNPGITFTVCVAVLLFSAQAQSADFTVINAPLAPNPNQTGDVIQIFGQATNAENYNNAGSIRLDNGASLIHGSNNLFISNISTSPVFTNGQGGSVSSSGKLLTSLPNGSSMYRNSQIYNFSTFNNTDAGSSFNNLNGAVLDNGVSPNLFGIASTNAIFNNQQGATINNAGAYQMHNLGFSPMQSSRINNYGTFTNSDSGSVINNENGAALSNGSNADGLFGNTVATANLVNQNGAQINNSGVFISTSQTSYPGHLSSNINNDATLTNSGENTRLNNLNGALINNGSQNWSGLGALSPAQLINENAATLSNSGAFTHVGNGGYVDAINSTLNNIQATLINSGNGSQLINAEGAVINNGESYSSFNLYSNPSQLTNQNGAEMVNTGAYHWTDENGITRIDQSIIKNIGATITNNGIGSKLNNQKGAALINGESFGLFNRVPSVLSNQNGATLTNSGVHHWQDQNGQNQVIASQINNEGTLINIGTGTALHNREGARIVNSMFGILENKDGALIANDTASSVSNDGKIINDALITNAGSFQVGQGSMEGNGQYVQTAGETILSGGFFATPQWTQSLTTIQGGTFTGTGTMNSAVVIDGGTLALGSSDNFNTGLLLNHPGLTINGDLNFNNGLIKILVDSDSFFGNPFLPNLFAVTDSLRVTGSTTFNGGVVEIDFVNGFTPTLGESLAWLTFSGDINGLDNLQYRFTGLANDRTLAFNRDGNHLTWTVTTAAVPLPASSWLFVTGVLSLMAKRGKAIS